MKRIWILFLILVVASVPFLQPKKADAEAALKIATVLEESFAQAFMKKAGWKPVVIQGGKTEAQMSDDFGKVFIKKLKNLPVSTFEEFDVMMNQATPVPNRPGWLKVVVGTYLLVTGLDILSDIYNHLNTATYNQPFDYANVEKSFITMGFGYTVFADPRPGYEGHWYVWFPDGALEDHTFVSGSIITGFSAIYQCGNITCVDAYYKNVDTGEIQYVSNNIQLVVSQPSVHVAPYTTKYLDLGSLDHIAITENTLVHVPMPIEIEFPDPAHVPDWQTQIIEIPQTAPYPESLPEPMKNPWIQPFSPDHFATPLKTPLDAPNPYYDPVTYPSPNVIPSTEPLPDIDPLPQPDPAPDPAPSPLPNPAPTPLEPPPGAKLDLTPLTNVGTELSNKFPFSIPWDIKRQLDIFNVQPTAPNYEIDVPEFVKIGSYSIPLKFKIDFNHFDTFARIARWFLTICFDLAIIMGIRKFLPEA